MRTALTLAFVFLVALWFASGSPVTLRAFLAALGLA